MHRHVCLSKTIIANTSMCAYTYTYIHIYIYIYIYIQREREREREISHNAHGTV